MELCNTSFSASSQASPAPESQNINQQRPAVLKHGFTAGTGTFQKVRMTALQTRASFWPGEWPLPLLQAARRQLRALAWVRWKQILLLAQKESQIGETKRRQRRQNTALLCLGQLQACCSWHREEGRAAHAKTSVGRLKCSQNTLYIKPKCSISCALFQPQGNAAARAVSEQCYVLDKSCLLFRSWWAELGCSPGRDIRKMLVVRPKCFPAKVRYEARF